MGNDIGGPIGSASSRDGGSLDNSVRGVHTGNRPVNAAADGTDATPVTTELYVAEVMVPRRGTVTGVGLFNGSVAAGNVKVALHTASGVRIALSASVAVVGTDAFQRVPFAAPIVVPPGTYYVGAIFNNVANRYNAHAAPGNFGSGKITGTTFAAPLATITPPTTFTADLGPMGGLY